MWTRFISLNDMGPSKGPFDEFAGVRALIALSLTAGSQQFTAGMKTE
jgi:hypothetical protein